VESCRGRKSRWQRWSGIPAKWPLWFQSLLRGAAHISIAVSSIFGSSTASFILFRRFWAILLPSSSQSLLSSLLRYIQPYGRATITFSFRQLSLFLLHQSHSFTMMQFSALCCRQNRVNLAECRTDDPLGRTHLETKIAGLVRVALCSQS